MNPITFGPFRGINNRLPDFAMHSDAGDWLRSATNVDVDDSGHLRRRPGQTRVQALTDPHSLLRTSDGRFFMGLASALYLITLPAYSQTLVKSLSSNAHIDYVEHNGDLYYSNGTDSGRISAANVWYPWALPTPALPSVATISGSLAAGKYQVAVTYSNSVTGEEGGRLGATQYTLSAAGALRVTLPGAVTGATHVNIYVSALNGSLLYLHGSVATGTASYDITTTTTTRQAELNHLEPLPAGTGVFFHQGRLGVISGNSVLYCDPWRPGYYRPIEGIIPFEKPVSLVVPAQNGCYIVADKTRWFAGDLGNPASIVDVLPYAGVPGTAFAAVSDMTVGWFSAAGVVIADPSGQASAVMADPIDLTAPASGCSIVLVSNGFERVLSCGWSVNLTNKAATQHGAFDYTSFAGGYYGTKADGVYQITGATDNGAPIAASFGLGKLDGSTPQKKRLRILRLGASSGDSMSVSVATPEHPSSYSYDSRRISGDLSIQHVRLARGLEASWFDIAIGNRNGCDFTVDTIMADIILLPWRV